MPQSVPLENDLWEKFCQVVASGTPIYKAYQDVFPAKSTGSQDTLRSKASSFARKKEIARRIRTLVAEKQETVEAEVVSEDSEDDKASKKALILRLEAIAYNDLNEPRDIIRAVETIARLKGIMPAPPTAPRPAQVPQRVVNNQTNILIENKEGEEISKEDVEQVDIMGKESSMRLQQAFQLHLASRRIAATSDRKP